MKILIGAVFFFAVVMVSWALLIAVLGAMFLNTSFHEGWHLAWSEPWKLLVFGLFTLPLLAWTD